MTFRWQNEEIRITRISNLYAIRIRIFFLKDSPIRIDNIESSRARNRLYPRHVDGRFLSFLIIFIVLVIYLLFCVLLPFVLTITVETAGASKLGRTWMQMSSFAYGMLCNSRKKRNRYFDELEWKHHYYNAMQTIMGKFYIFLIVRFLKGTISGFSK